MARRKRAVALFEVIHQAKPFERKLTPRPQVLPTPPITKIPQPPSKPTKPFSEVVAEMITPWREAAARHLPPLQQKLKSFIAQQGSILAGAGTAFAVIGLIALARHQAHATSPVAGSGAVASVQDLRTQPAHPSVLQIDTDQATAPPKAAQAPANVAPVSPAIADAQTASSVNAPSARQFNLNYILVQSYADEKTADLAADFLNKNNVPCTVERQIKNWRRDFYYVVGLKGFTRASGTEYVSYRKNLQTLSVEFSTSQQRNYKGFEPMAIKWLPLN